MSSAHGSGGGLGVGVGGGAEEGSGMKKGPWTAAEDAILMEYVKKHGEGNWNSVQKNSGLSRCGKSCRLRWANHLRPNLKKGAFSPDEECLILQLHSKLGNKWARMASHLPGRTDNEIKNYWNTRIKRRQRQGLPLYPPDIQRQAAMLAATRPPASSPSLHLLDHVDTPPPMGFYAQSFVHDAGYNGGHHQVHHFLPPGAIHRLKAGGFCLPFPSHGQMHPFLHQGQGPLHFGGAGMANLNPQPDAGASIKLELPSSQNPDPGSSSLIYERPATDLDAFLLHSGDGGEDGYLLDPRLGKASLGGHPLPMSLNASSSNAVHWTGSGGGGDSNSNHPLPPGISQKEEEGLTTLFNIMPAAATAGVVEWCSDSGEASNSALTEDVDIVLDMQQLASSVSISAAAGTSPDLTGAGDDKEWDLASCSWNNMPNIC